MSEVTRILSEIESGDPHAAERLLPLVYTELRKLATARMANERDDHSLQPTALVHEAYLRLVVGATNDRDSDQARREWDDRGHFFAAASEAMRRILVESARRRDSLKRGAKFNQVELDHAELAYSASLDNVIAVDEALMKLTEADPRCAELVKLRYFVGLPLSEAAQIMGISRATAFRYWAYAKAFLSCELDEENDS